MREYLSIKARREKSYIILVEVEDEAGAAGLPVTLQWTLSDVNDNIVNSRQDVVVAVPAVKNYIVLDGEDLNWLADETGEIVARKFCCEGTYNSITGGVLKFQEESYFYIKGNEC